MTWGEPLADSRRQRGWHLLGGAIRRRRLSLGWTQRLLEAESGIDQTVISRIDQARLERMLAEYDPYRVPAPPQGATPDAQHTYPSYP